MKRRVVTVRGRVAVEKKSIGHPRVFSQVTCRRVEHRVDEAVLRGCPYFAAMLSTGFAESGSSVIVIHDDAPCAAKPQALGRAIEWLSAGACEIADFDEALVLLETARFMQIDLMEKYCLAWLHVHVDDHGLRAWKEAARLSCEELARIALPSIGLSLCALSHTQAFLDLERADLLALLDQDMLPVHTEEVVCDAAMRWLRHDDGRVEALTDVLAAVRLTLLPPAYLASVAIDPLVFADHAAMRLVATATFDRVTGRPRRPPRPRAFSLAGTIVFVGGHVDRREVAGVSLWDPRGTDSKTYDLPPLPTCVSEARCVFVDGVLYVLGGSVPDRRLWSYDPAVGEWVVNACTFTVGWDFALVATADAIYALGGRVTRRGGEPDEECVATSGVYKYNLSARKRERVPDMRFPRALAAAAVVGGKVLVFGGHDQDDLATVEEYDPETRAWRDLPPMPVARSGGVAVAIAGPSGPLVYLVGGSVGGDDESVRMDAYEHGTGVWSRLPDIPLDLYGAGVSYSAMEVDGRLWVSGGSASSLFCYEGGAWTSRQCHVGRSHSAVAAMPNRLEVLN